MWRASILRGLLTRRPMRDSRRPCGERRSTRTSSGSWRCGSEEHGRFRTRIMAPGGKYTSEARGMPRGLPQGGVLSPLLWILHFDRFLRLMEEWDMQDEGGGKRVGPPEGSGDEVAYVVYCTRTGMRRRWCPWRFNEQKRWREPCGGWGFAWDDRNATTW